MSPKQRLLLATRSLLALAAAFAVFALANVAGGELADRTGFPEGNDARLGWDLAWVFIAGVVAAGTAVKLAPRAPRAHAVALFLLMLAICVLAVWQLGGDWPRWFSAGLLLTLPLQAWLGARLATRGDGRA